VRFLVQLILQLSFINRKISHSSLVFKNHRTIILLFVANKSFKIILKLADFNNAASGNFVPDWSNKNLRKYSLKSLGQ